MIRVKLRDAMENYHLQFGERITYAQLAEATGLSRATLESIASRSNYNATLQTVEKLCIALGCDPGELLELEE